MECNMTRKQAFVMRGFRAATSGSVKPAQSVGNLSSTLGWTGPGDRHDA
jgi:hypothetical protein